MLVDTPKPPQQASIDRQPLHREDPATPTTGVRRDAGLAPVTNGGEES